MIQQNQALGEPALKRSASTFDRPKHLPANDVGRVLAALGVVLPAMTPMIWYRVEHLASLDAILKAMHMTVDQLVAEIEAREIKAPDLRRIADIPALIGKGVSARVL